jgi:hypothetical protein
MQFGWIEVMSFFSDESKFNLFGNNIVGEGVESVFWANIVKFGGRSIMV